MAFERRALLLNLVFPARRGWRLCVAGMVMGFLKRAEMINADDDWVVEAGLP